MWIATKSVSISSFLRDIALTARLGSDRNCVICDSDFVNLRFKALVVISWSDFLPQNILLSWLSLAPRNANCWGMAAKVAIFWVCPEMLHNI